MPGSQRRCFLKVEGSVLVVTLDLGDYGDLRLHGEADVAALVESAVLQANFGECTEVRLEASRRYPEETTDRILANIRKQLGISDDSS